MVLCYETLPVGTIKLKTVQKDCPMHPYHLSSTWNCKIPFKWKESMAEAKGGLFTGGSISAVGKNNRISSIRVWLILGIIFIFNLSVILIVFNQDSPPAILPFFSRTITVQKYWSLLQTKYFRDASIQKCKNHGSSKRSRNSENFACSFISSSFFFHNALIQRGDLM